MSLGTLENEHGPVTAPGAETSAEGSENVPCALIGWPCGNFAWVGHRDMLILQSTKRHTSPHHSTPSTMTKAQTQRPTSPVHHQQQRAHSSPIAHVETKYLRLPKDAEDVEHARQCAEDDREEAKCEEGRLFIPQVYKLAQELKEAPPAEVLNMDQLENYLELLADVDTIDLYWDDYDEEWVLSDFVGQDGAGVRWSKEGATFSFCLRDFSDCEPMCCGCDTCEVQDAAFVYRTYK